MKSKNTAQFINQVPLNHLKDLKLDLRVLSQRDKAVLQREKIVSIENLVPTLFQLALMHSRIV